MGRKKNPTSDMGVQEKQSTPLATRLDQLITDTNALKDYLGISVQAINQYRLGIARPSLENLCKIADFYNVSTDYLLGRTEIKPLDATMQAAAEYTGMSQSVLTWLHTKDSETVQIVEQILQSDGFKMALPAISLLRSGLSQTERLKDYNYDEFYEIECKMLDFGYHSISNRAYHEWQRHRIAQFIESAIEKLIPIDSHGPTDRGANNAINQEEGD